MSDKMKKSNEDKYQLMLLGFEKTLSNLENPCEVLVSKFFDLKQKCMDNSTSADCYEQLASLHLDCAEQGIVCDSAALLLYESHIREGNW